jgi:hypothetical protein
MRLPNFFIAGAPKAGTDLLYYQLEQHPEIYMSPLKEPCYFSAEIRLENFHPSLRSQAERAAASLREYLDAGAPGKRFGGMVSDLRDYQRLFASAKDEKAIGEGSVCYLWSETAAAAIAHMLPKAKIILVLMDPSERAFHQYLKSLSDGTVGHSFRRHLEMALKDANGNEGQLRPYHPFLAFGLYTQQVRRYLDRFPADQLAISLYEDTQANYREWFAGILSFLEVSSSFAPPEVDVPSKPHVPRFAGMSHALHLRGIKKLAAGALPEGVKRALKRRRHATNHLPELLPEDRAVLVTYYREDVLRLQDLIRKDLSAWLR